MLLLLSIGDLCLLFVRLCSRCSPLVDVFSWKVLLIFGLFLDSPRCCPVLPVFSSQKKMCPLGDGAFNDMSSPSLKASGLRMRFYQLRNLSFLLIRSTTTGFAVFRTYP